MGKSIRSKSKRQFRTVKRTTFLREQDKIIRVTRKIRASTITSGAPTTIALMGALGGTQGGQAVVAMDAGGSVRARTVIGAAGGNADWRASVIAHEAAAARAGDAAASEDKSVAPDSSKVRMATKLALAAIRGAHHTGEDDDAAEADDKHRGFSFQRLAREVQAKRPARQGHLGGTAMAPNSAGEAAFSALREGRGHRGKKGEGVVPGADGGFKSRQAKAAAKAKEAEGVAAMKQ